MRQWTAWLCILIALASPVVSQAKVAYGLALSITELGRNILESTQEEEDEDYDGRDVVALAADAPASLDAVTFLPASLDALPGLPPPVLAPVACPVARLRHGQWRWPPPTAQERHALLQTFLF